MTVKNLLISMGLFLTALIYSCSIYDTRPSPKKYFKHTKTKHSAIFQMIRTDGDHVSCTGFAISDEYALTAGHCIKMSAEDTVGSTYAKPDVFIIRNARRQDTGVRAVAVVKNFDATKFTRFDYAVLKGNFRDFRKMKLSGTLRLHKGDDYYACGYPGGKTPVLCTNWTARKAYNFKFEGTGYVVGGMSGGPVIDDYGFAVGIISSIQGDKVRVQPTVGVVDLE